MLNRIRAVVTFLCLVSLTSHSASFPAAFVSPAGTVKLNGSIVKSSATVLVGDELETFDSSAANITSANVTAQISPASRIRIGTNSLDLLSGCIRIEGSKSAKVRAAGLELAPMIAAKFIVYRRNSRILAGVISGTVFIRGTEQPQQLEGGDTLELSDSSAPQAPHPAAGAPKKRDRQLLAFLVGAAATGTVLATSHLHRADREHVSAP